MSTDPITQQLAAMLDREDAETEGAPRVTTGAATYTGRGPTGRLRNFRAMSDVKFRRESLLIYAENNDPEAYAAVNAEYRRRIGGEEA